MELEKSIEINDIQKAADIINSITEKIDGYEEYIDNLTRFDDFKKMFFRMKEYSDLINAVESLVTNEEWQKAKLLLIDKVLPFYDEYKEEIEEKIAYCKIKEGDSISFNDSIDLEFQYYKTKEKSRII